MAQVITVNLGSTSIAQCVVTNYTTLRPSQVPDVVLGDQKELLILIAKGDQLTLADESNSNSFSMKVAVGTPGLKPTTGTFTVTFGISTSAAISYGASASTVQTALNAMTTISGAGGVTVSGDDGGPWQVTFNSVGSRALMTGDNANLYPASDVVISTSQNGTASIQEIQTIKLARRAAAYQDTWPISGSGRQAFIDYNVQGLADLLGDENEADAVFEIELTDGSGNRRTICQQTCKVRRELIDAQTGVPTPLSSYYTAAEINAFLAGLFDYDSESFSTAGTTTVTVTSGVKLLTLKVQASAGAEAYTRNIDLDNTDRLKGDRIDCRLEIAASANPTIVFRDAATAAVLATYVGNASFAQNLAPQFFMPIDEDAWGLYEG